MDSFHFVRNEASSCCLCGSRRELTGEHKVKASAISQEFGRSQMVVGRFDGEESNMRYVQGPKSRALHFKARLCKPCNGDRTQAADQAFDQLNSICRTRLENGESIENVMNEVGSGGDENYLSTFRYFAKLLCCHLAEVGGPRPVHMSRFAVGDVNENCVWLNVRRNPIYSVLSDELRQAGYPRKLPYAAHGGLVIYTDKRTGKPTGFHSSLTFGEVQYIFWSRLTPIEKLTLRLTHSDFVRRCCSVSKATRSDPIGPQLQRKLGIK